MKIWLVFSVEKISAPKLARIEQRAQQSSLQRGTAAITISSGS
jgi:hypothetical protein